jgi:hypothetical protein
MLTMNRCSIASQYAIESIANYPIKTVAFAVFSVFSLTLVLPAAPALAQLSEPLPVREVRPAQQQLTPGVRSFPANVRRGTLKVLTSPEVLIDGKAERLSPGSRIRNVQNLVIAPASIAGEELVVNILRNPSGELQEVWLLNQLEARQKVTPNTPARNFIFGSEESSQVRQDDGKTPFNQLPTFEQLGRQQRAQQQR